VLVTPVGAHVEDDLVAGLDGLAEVGLDPVVVLAAEGVQDLLTVVAVPGAWFGGQPLDVGVEQVDDGVDAVTAGALVGGLEQVKVSAHGTLQRVLPGSAGGSGQQGAGGLAEGVDLGVDRAARAA
jgi:hypothetical protein